VKATVLDLLIDRDTIPPLITLIWKVFSQLMKLIIQIPCYNEAETLGITLAALPRKVEGFDLVEWLVIDDGSLDDTLTIAREHGVDHILRHASNQGLARAFMTGINACLRLGADVIVNTDADNQYNAEDIPKLTTPVIQGRADIVVGARPIEVIAHFSQIKKLFQRLGSWVVRIASKTDILDAPSGFRAMSRVAAQSLMVFNNYTYTLETIIQAGQKNMAIISVPIRVNEDLRPSRLVKSIGSYLKHSIVTIVRILIIYRPFRFFATIGLLLFGAGFLVGMRFLWFYMDGEGKGHVQSLILSGILLLMGFQTLLVAFLADLLGANRRLLEGLRERSYLLPNEIKAGRATPAPPVGDDGQG
jgi:glycosyltransferase involved in cell wall biosynthesis